MVQKVLVIAASTAKDSEEKIKQRMSELGPGWKITQLTHVHVIDTAGDRGVHTILVEKN